MGMVQGVCGGCGKTIRRDNPVPVVVTCDCYKICPLCGSAMEPYAPDLDPKTYRNEDDPSWDLLSQAEKGESSVNVVYVCGLHSPPFFSDRLPVEVALE